MLTQLSSPARSASGILGRRGFVLRLLGLEKSYGEKIILHNVTYAFPEGERIALVGANGTGKTTMIKIIAGIETADAGEIIKASDFLIGYLPQIPNPNPAKTIEAECLDGAIRVKKLEEQLKKALSEMQINPTAPTISAYEKLESAFKNAGGYSVLARARSILIGLGFKEKDFLTNPMELSSGWRMRLELGRLFICEPDFLMLDEPTNHLDLPSLVWVEKFLQSFRGTLLFVSHDRELLNRLSTITLHLLDGRLTAYSGNFDFFIEARELKADQEAAQIEQLRKKREQMESFVSRFGAKATKASQAQSRIKMIEKIRELEAGLSPKNEDESIRIRIPDPLPSAREVLKIKAGVTGYSNPLSLQIDLSVQRGWKIAIIGANGIGKSTFLKTIAGKQPPFSGLFQLHQDTRIAYYAQDHFQNLDFSKNLIQNLQKTSELSEREIRSLLGSFLFTGDDVYKSVSVLSGGELSRLSLASTLANRANLILLDEPTNHLDISSKEILINALKQYHGTIMFVSHDRSFIDGICTHVFAMTEDGENMLFEGNLDDYSRLSTIAGFPNVFDIEKNAIKPAGSNQTKEISSNHLGWLEAKNLEKNRRKFSKEKGQLEEQLDKLNERRHELEQLLINAAVADYKKAEELSLTLEQVKTELASVEELWIIVCGNLESLD